MPYFYIKTPLDGLVLTIKDGNATAGSPVVLDTKADDNAAQQWRFDDSTGTIRSKLNDLVFDISDNTLIVNTAADEIKEDQQWHKVDGNKILNIIEPNKCIDVFESDESVGARVIQYQFFGTTNQFWNFESPRQEFYIESQLNWLVATKKAHTWELVTAERDPSNPRNQLFYQDTSGYLHLVSNNFVLTAGKSDNVVLTPESNNPCSQWKFAGGGVKSGEDLALDIVASNTEPGAALCAWIAEDKPNQKWVKKIYDN